MYLLPLARDASAAGTGAGTAMAMAATVLSTRRVMEDAFMLNSNYDMQGLDVTNTSNENCSVGVMISCGLATLRTRTKEIDTSEDEEIFIGITWSCKSQWVMTRYVTTGDIVEAGTQPANH